ncbi:hypothetical protein PENTCL1PPCAC_3086 [Pristionchus entomophagus]|uniref:Uncharacterized protein n=1 Tax=Pristionchus entomophagus TaxID=358040 RepID=A0AAV5SC64_9BILA|nr:hypothetical protein PENTCL1PPCAC_3086 [Pristionchus entomophagus]
MDRLPLELWEAIGLSSNIDTTCPIFSSLLTEESFEKKCKMNGVQMLPEYIQKVMESHPTLTLDFLSLYHNNPFGSDIGRLGSVSPSFLTPFSLPNHVDGKGLLHLDPIVTLSPPDREAIEKNGEKRGTIVYRLDLEEIGIPSWLMDIFRPRFSLTVHAYRMPLSDGDILVSAKLLRSIEEGSTAVCRKEHQGWFMAGWQASDRPVEESVQMDFEVYGEGARVLSIVASCSGGGRLGQIEVKLHFGSEVSSDIEEQLAIWERSKERKKEKREGQESEMIQTSECRTILGVERNELVLRSSATLSLSRKSSASSTFSLDVDTEEEEEEE